MRPFALPKALAIGILCLLSMAASHAGTVTVIRAQQGLAADTASLRG